MPSVRHLTKPCDHRCAVFGYDYWDADNGILVEYIRCMCGERLSLGPARDDGPHAAAVAIEKRAAEIVAGWSYTREEADGEIGQLVTAIIFHDHTPETADARLAELRATHDTGGCE